MAAHGDQAGAAHFVRGGTPRYYIASLAIERSGRRRRHRCIRCSAWRRLVLLAWRWRCHGRHRAVVSGARSHSLSRRRHQIMLSWPACHARPGANRPGVIAAAPSVAPLASAMPERPRPREIFLMPVISRVDSRSNGFIACSCRRPPCAKYRRHGRRFAVAIIATSVSAARNGRSSAHFTPVVDVLLKRHHLSICSARKGKMPTRRQLIIVMPCRGSIFFFHVLPSRRINAIRPYISWRNRGERALSSAIAPLVGYSTPSLPVAV